jgi:adenylate cyclase
MENDKKYTILIVDDDQMYLHTINHIIKNINDNIETEIATNALDAEKKAEYNPPDLIIIDWEMPAVSGIDFIKRLQLNPNLSEIPAIVCTGRMTDSENLKTAFDAGAVDFIRKPIDKIELISRVNSMIRLSESYLTIKKQREELIIEKEKADRLLSNILPKKIAHKLKEGGKTEPEEFDNITIFFSDMVGFTEQSAKLEPKKIIEELNDIFTGFDEIMEKHHCERIKTVGDAYIAVCGMPEKNPNHAINILSAAKEIIEFLNHRNKIEKITWELRIGIHTGSVVGGIVGTRKYIYDIFGDSINISSRLESNSIPMRALVSEITRDLVYDHFMFDAPREIDIKGKGKMKAYLLV